MYEELVRRLRTISPEEYGNPMDFAFGVQQAMCEAAEGGSMSVLIKGFPLPNNCGACPLRLAWCRERIYMVTRPERCPLIPVPPHGRLIDADEFEKENAYFWHCDFINPKYDDTLADLIEAAPTIIPASEEGAKTEEDSEPWLCLSCRHYPPSSTDGKPCSQCNPSEVWHSCYDSAEEGE